MLVGKYKASSHSVIRDLFYEACEKTKRFGAENVFDYTLGNPSVPVPAAYDAVLKRLADDPDFTTVHGYSAGAGIESVREKIAAFLKGRYGLPYAARHRRSRTLYGASSGRGRKSSSFPRSFPNTDRISTVPAA